MKKYLIKLKDCFLIAIQLHSKAPTKEIKRLWEIFALCCLPCTILELFSGHLLFGFIPTFRNEFFDNYGNWVFFMFVIVFCIVFFDLKKCKEITLKMKESQKSTKDL